MFPYRFPPPRIRPVAEERRQPLQVRASSSVPVLARRRGLIIPQAGLNSRGWFVSRVCISRISRVSRPPSAAPRPGPKPGSGSKPRTSVSSDTSVVRAIRNKCRNFRTAPPPGSYRLRRHFPRFCNGSTRVRHPYRVRFLRDGNQGS